MWGKNKPIKPELLCDGGNIASNGLDYTEHPDLSLLTTGRDVINHPFTWSNATSSATAQAAWMGAKIASLYPDAWPETIRALLVHSATWTDEMKQQFCIPDRKRTGRRTLLKACGYGKPDLEKAIRCKENSVNLIIQGEIKPYENGKVNEMHLHALPWPKEELRNLEDKEAELKVTLSYFIEPGPGEIGWNNKYRYPSFGLRFEVINKDESLEDFKKRINKKMREDDPKDKGQGTSGSNDWFLGSENRDVGSIHSDSKSIPAIDLCEANYLAVYPIAGWWKERSHLNKGESEARYSLIVSITTPEENVEFLTEIVTQIENVITVPI